MRNQEGSEPGRRRRRKRRRRQAGDLRDRGKRCSYVSTFRSPFLDPSRRRSLL